MHEQLTVMPIIEPESIGTGLIKFVPGIRVSLEQLCSTYFFSGKELDVLGQIARQMIATDMMSYSSSLFIKGEVRFLELEVKKTDLRDRAVFQCRIKKEKYVKEQEQENDDDTRLPYWHSIIISFTVRYFWQEQPAEMSLVDSLTEPFLETQVSSRGQKK